jgi:hypothetical protein
METGISLTLLPKHDGQPSSFALTLMNEAHQ